MHLAHMEIPGVGALMMKAAVRGISHDCEGCASNGQQPWRIKAEMCKIADGRGAVHACRQELQGVVLRTKPAKAVQFLRELAPDYVPGAKSLRHASSHVTEAAAILRYREKVC